METKKTHQIGEVVLILLAMLFTAIGCERKLAKSPVEQIQSLNEAALAGAEAEELGGIIERNVPMRDAASRPYAVVVDANTLEHPEWGQVVKALKKKYNAKVFVAHYPEVWEVRKALNEYMPWYVCFVAQPEQATREMITAAAYTMTWLDDDPYEDAIWAVLTGFVAKDALRIINAEPLVVRKELSNMWDNWLDWLEVGVSLGSDSDDKFIKNSDGVKQQLEGPKERTPEFVKVLNQDDCDIITTSAHATEHVFYLGYPNTASDGYITHNDKGDIYGIDTLGKVHHVNAKKPKIYYSPGNCLIGHIDGQSCLSLAWIHNGVNAFFGHIYVQDRPCYAWAIAEYFMALQGRYTFAEATYANWLALRFSVDEQLEVYPCCDRGGKGTVLYGDPAWEARVKHTTVPAYSQDLNIENLSDGLIKMTASVTVNSEWEVWVPSVRPVILLPFRIKEARIEKTDLKKVGVADNFIVLDLDTPSIGGSDLPVGTKKSVVLYARKLEVWPFLSDNEVVTRIREVPWFQVAACIGDLGKVKAFLGRGIDINAKDTRNRTALHYAAEEGHKKIVELLLARGADLNASTSYDRTAAELAMSRGHTEIVKLLVSKGADISPLHLAIYLKDVAKSRSLIESGADVNKRTPYGITPLNVAVDAGLRDLANLLIDKGADVNAKDNWDWTPLHSAVYKDKEMVDLLITRGANVDAKDGAARTPLWYAEKDGHTEIVELLRKHGAKE